MVNWAVGAKFLGIYLIVEDRGVQVFKLVTQPDVDQYVPKKIQRYMPGNLEYTDIIRYDPAHLKSPPFVLHLHSVPPVFARKVTNQHRISPTSSLGGNRT